MAKKFNINSQTVVGPIAAFTMAGLLFVYSRTSIKAAKRNAERHRSADGGQISWRNENLRRHGMLKRPEDDVSLGHLVREANDRVDSGVRRGQPRLEADEILRAKKRRPGAAS
ncbi:hypothetical protein MMC07_008538 [Pseudocyphellaria aurata]|nr:hypothetical protein [Pseudocyphellaria aurata]